MKVIVFFNNMRHLGLHPVITYKHKCNFGADIHTWKGIYIIMSCIIRVFKSQTHIQFLKLL